MNERLFLQCGPGLEPALLDELTELRLRGVAVAGGVEVEAPSGTYRQLNLHSRVANRVLLRVAQARSPGELARLDLAGFGRTFALEASGSGAQPFRDQVARGRALSADGVPLLVRVENQLATVSVDTSGELLYFRGYRQEIGRAPLRETLASGLLRLAKWQPIEPLWDPMCGSGTVLIEAAERALGLAAGRARSFRFESFPSHDQSAWTSLPRQVPGVVSSLRGGDLNAGALGTARRNAKRSGVLEHLKLERADATALVPVGPPGLVLSNLPYGKRVGEKSELGALYRAFGASLRRACAGWRFALLLEEGEALLGLRIEQRFELNNGGLRCAFVTGHVTP